MDSLTTALAACANLAVIALATLSGVIAWRLWHTSARNDLAPVPQQRLGKRQTAAPAKRKPVVITDERAAQIERAEEERAPRS